MKKRILAIAALTTIAMPVLFMLFHTWFWWNYFTVTRMSEKVMEVLE